jgi:hypothetical protein
MSSEGEEGEVFANPVGIQSEGVVEKVEKAFFLSIGQVRSGLDLKNIPLNKMIYGHRGKISLEHLLCN